MAQRPSNNSNKGKGGKPRNKGFKGGKPKYNPKKEEEIREPKDGDVNDSSFYYLDDTLRDQLMNYSFNSFNGVKDVFDTSVPGIGASSQTSEFLNGNVMTIYLNPSVTPPVNPNAPTDGINLVGMRNYTVLSSNNSKTTIYLPQDVTILMCAMKALAETLCWNTRNFGFLYLYNQRNREIPDKLLKDNYIDPDDFRKNAAGYRIRFNTMLTAVNRIPFFSNFGAFAKAKEIYSNVYYDEDSPMCQYYEFTPYSTWLFDEAYDSNGAGLKTWMKYGAGTYRYMSQVLDDIQTMIDALLNSSSLNAIYSDILRVFEKGNGTLMHFDLIPDFYAVEFKKSDEIDLYIDNLTIMNEPAESTAGAGDENDMSCDANANLVKYNPVWKSNQASTLKWVWGMYSHGLVNFKNPNPNVEERVAATRLASRMKFVLTSATDIESVRVAIGDYYVVKVMVSDCVDMPSQQTILSGSCISPFATVAVCETWFRNITQLSKFRHAPRIYLMNPTGVVNGLLGISGDLNYYTDIDFELLRSMYDAEMLGEFALRV